jgi:hypothetical protein
MSKRKLRIVRENPLLGICEYCDMQLPATLTALGAAVPNSVREQFNAHKCKREDFSQAAVRTVREATERDSS